MRILVGSLVVVVGVAVVAPSTGADGGPLVIAAVAAALLLVVVPGVNRVLFGRKYGWGDGCCPTCRGEGKAYYGTGSRTYRRRCQECGGSGSGAGGPGRESDLSGRRLREV